MPFNPTVAHLDALMPLVFSSDSLEPLDPLEHRHFRLVTPHPSCVSANRFRRLPHRPLAEI
jgi:hypothetical protein